MRGELVSLTLKWEKRDVNQPNSRLFSPPLQLVLSEPANRDEQKAAQYVLSL